MVFNNTFEHICSFLCTFPHGQRKRYDIKLTCNLVRLWMWLWFISDLAYNIALCHYSLRQYAAALKYIREIIERGIREHPGLYPFIALPLKMSLCFFHMGGTVIFCSDMKLWAWLCVPDEVILSPKNELMEPKWCSGQVKQITPCYLLEVLKNLPALLVTETNLVR